jgi:hypothetical protein
VRGVIYLNIKITKNGKFVNCAVFNNLATAKAMYPDCEFEIIETQEEKDRKLELAKKNKITELAQKCEEVITNGFYSDITGEKILYSYALTDQENYNSLYEMVKMAKEDNESILNYFKELKYPKNQVGIKGKAANDVFKFISYDAFEEFWLIGKKHVNTIRYTKYYPLKEKVLKANTIEEVNKITW